MSLVCAQCSRVNPPEAAYCYHDGAALAGRAGGPINAGAAPFPNQFVFPDGLSCRNFDQFAMACQQNWASALKLLQQGFLGSFFGGMGRVDLAMAAQEAAKFPDLDRGLDQLLAKLPTQALEAPKVQAEPSEISLGQVKIGEDRATELHLTNLGMRLLYGTVTSNCKWLTLGDAPGHPEKMFQFGADTVIPVHVRGQFLRAGTKPIEGKLEIDSNGGAIEVTIKADVPVAPCPAGLFSGSLTPRQIAEKAKANVKEAVPYFERGDIAKWYASNGWDYPVKGPIMSGMGSIQQFFEALGVAKAPKVAFSPKALNLAGAVGKTLDTVLEVTTAERKVVYGWASCDQPWVEVGKTKLTGKLASVPITIRIPDPCPPTLEAILTLFGNGNQKVAVPLKVTVAGGKAGVSLAEELAPVEIIEDDAPVIVELLDAPAPFTPPRTPYPAPTPIPMVIQEAPPPAPAPAPMPVVMELVEDDNPFAITDKPAAPKPGAATVPGSTVTSSKPAERLPLPVRLLLHFVPMAVLSLCCLILIVCDIISPGKGKGSLDGDEVDLRPFIEIKFDEGRDKEKKDYTDSMTFAVHMLNPDSPRVKVKLNYYENGFGNSTVVKIDGQESTFGVDGKWGPGFQNGGKDTGTYGGKTRMFEMANSIFVTQTVTIEPGEPVEVKPGEYKRLLNTCLVRYTIHNRDGNKKSHNVGLRVLMDTCIGDNDGAPFTFPGVKEVVDTKRDFQGSEVPDFVQVLEKDTLRDPGIVVQLGLRLSEKFEMPNRFMLTRYPGNDKRFLSKWEVALVDMKLPGEPQGDSSVVIYWNPKPLRSDEKRELAFTYGLGSMSHDAKLISLTASGATYRGGELTILALVQDPNAKEITLTLPAGLELIKGQTLKQPVEKMRANRPNPITWRVRAISEGKHEISVRTDTDQSQKRRLTITAKSLFN